MAQFQPQLSDVIDCIDIFSQIKNTQWLLQSMNDAIESRYKDPQLTDNLIYLIHEYTDKMKEQIQELSQAFEKVQVDRDFDQEWKDFMNGNS